MNFGKSLCFNMGAKCRKQNRPTCFQLVCMSAIMSEVSVRHATRQGQAHVPGSGSNLGSENRMNDECQFVARHRWFLDLPGVP